MIHTSYITLLKDKEKFHYKGKIVNLKEGDFFLLKPEELTFYQADSKEPWAYYWLGITGGKSLIILLFLKFLINPISSNLKLVIPRLLQNSSQTLSTSLRLQKSSELAQLHIMGQLHELMFHLGTIAPQSEKKRIFHQPTNSILNAND